MKTAVVRICLIVLAFLLTVSCSQKSEYQEVQGLAQGTYYRVVYQDNKYRKAEFDSILAQFDTTFSVYNSQSLITKINNDDSTALITNEFRYFIEKSQYVWQITQGAFDITVAPLVNAWNFGTDTAQHLIPTQQQLDSIREFVGMEKLQLCGNKLVKADYRLQLTGNAIAQGYSTDLIARYLDSLGVQNYLVDVGSEMRSKGVNSRGKTWTIGITRPEEGIDKKPLTETYNVALYLNNSSLATSGNYRKFFYENGQKYSHTVNPQTGKSIPSDLLSATVIGEECIEVDAVATACMVMGVKKSMQFFERHKEYDAILMYVQGDSLVTYKTSGVRLKD